jgi:hypothetical protein
MFSQEILEVREDVVHIFEGLFESAMFLGEGIDAQEALDLEESGEGVAVEVAENGGGLLVGQAALDELNGGELTLEGVEELEVNDGDVVKEDSLAHPSVEVRGDDGSESTDGDALGVDHEGDVAGNDLKSQAKHANKNVSNFNKLTFDDISRAQFYLRNGVQQYQPLTTR